MYTTRGKSILLLLLILSILLGSTVMAYAEPSSTSTVPTNPDGHYGTPDGQSGGLSGGQSVDSGLAQKLIDLIDDFIEAVKKFGEGTEYLSEKGIFPVIAYALGNFFDAILAPLNESVLADAIFFTPSLTDSNTPLGKLLNGLYGVVLILAYVSISIYGVVLLLYLIAGKVDFRKFITNQLWLAACFLLPLYLIPIGINKVVNLPVNAMFQDTVIASAISDFNAGTNEQTIIAAELTNRIVSKTDAIEVQVSVDSRKPGKNDRVYLKDFLNSNTNTALVSSVDSTKAIVDAYASTIYSTAFTSLYEPVDLNIYNRVTQYTAETATTPPNKMELIKTGSKAFFYIDRDNPYISFSRDIILNDAVFPILYSSELSHLTDSSKAEFKRRLEDSEGFDALVYSIDLAIFDSLNKNIYSLYHTGTAAGINQETIDKFTAALITFEINKSYGLKPSGIEFSNVSPVLMLKSLLIPKTVIATLSAENSSGMFTYISVENLLAAIFGWLLAIVLFIYGILKSSIFILLVFLCVAVFLYNFIFTQGENKATALYGGLFLFMVMAIFHLSFMGLWKLLVIFLNYMSLSRPADYISVSILAFINALILILYLWLVFFKIVLKKVFKQALRNMRDLGGLGFMEATQRATKALGKFNSKLGSKLGIKRLENKGEIQAYRANALEDRIANRKKYLEYYNRLNPLRNPLTGKEIAKEQELLRSEIDEDIKRKDREYRAIKAAGSVSKYLELANRRSAGIKEDIKNSMKGLSNKKLKIIEDALKDIDYLEGNKKLKTDEAVLRYKTERETIDYGNKVVGVRADISGLEQKDREEFIEFLNQNNVEVTEDGDEIEAHTDLENFTKLSEEYAKNKIGLDLSTSGLKVNARKRIKRHSGYKIGQEFVVDGATEEDKSANKEKLFELLKAGYVAGHDYSLNEDGSVTIFNSELASYANEFATGTGKYTITDVENKEALTSAVSGLGESIQEVSEGVYEFSSSNTSLLEMDRKIKSEMEQESALSLDKMYSTDISSNREEVLKALEDRTLGKDYFLEGNTLYTKKNDRLLNKLRLDGIIDGYDESRYLYSVSGDNSYTDKFVSTIGMKASKLSEGGYKVSAEDIKDRADLNSMLKSVYNWADGGVSIADLDNRVLTYSGNDITAVTKALSGMFIEGLDYEVDEQEKLIKVAEKFNGSAINSGELPNLFKFDEKLKEDIDFNRINNVLIPKTERATLAVEKYRKENGTINDARDNFLYLAEALNNSLSSVELSEEHSRFAKENGIFRGLSEGSDYAVQNNKIILISDKAKRAVDNFNSTLFYEGMAKSAQYVNTFKERVSVLDTVLATEKHLDIDNPLQKKYTKTIDFIGKENQKDELLAQAIKGRIINDIKRAQAEGKDPILDGVHADCDIIVEGGSLLVSADRVDDFTKLDPYLNGIRGNQGEQKITYAIKLNGLKGNQVLLKNIDRGKLVSTNIVTDYDMSQGVDYTYNLKYYEDSDGNIYMEDAVTGEYDRVSRSRVDLSKAINMSADVYSKKVDPKAIEELIKAIDDDIPKAELESKVKEQEAQIRAIEARLSKMAKPTVVSRSSEEILKDLDEHKAETKSSKLADSVEEIIRRADIALEGLSKKALADKLDKLEKAREINNARIGVSDKLTRYETEESKEPETEEAEESEKVEAGKVEEVSKPNGEPTKK